VVLGPDGAPVARTSFRRGDAPRIALPSRLREVRVRVVHDVDGDGTDGADPVVERGPLTLPADGSPVVVDAR
jgi:hypothetical protein